jgi:YYY domain-containing protein
LGAVAVINTWDLPTYLGLMVVAFLLNDYRRLKGTFTLQQGALLLIRGVGFAVALLAATYLLYAPFFINYQPPAETGLGWVHTKTLLDQHLKIWGFFLFIIVSWLWISLLHPASRNSLLHVISMTLRRWNVWPHLFEIYRKVVKRQSESYQLGLWGVGLVILITLGLALLGYRVPVYLFPLVVLALLLLFRPEVSAETAYLNLLTFTGLSILLGVEFFFLRDWLGGSEAYRMNTLFKFFTQVWIIFGLVAAVTLPQLWQWSQRWPWSGQLAWISVALVLLLATLTYPLLGTRVRIDDRFPGDNNNRPAIGTLDGLAYMTVGTFEFEWPPGSRTFNPVQLKYDYEAIRWLQDNVSGTPIIAEAKIGYYREGGMRVAAYTGFPSILGGLHQNEQRPPSEIGERDFVVNGFWTNPDPAQTLELMDELDVSYIYIGQVERINYGDDITDKFDQLVIQGELEVVFKNEKTKIYRRT